MRIYMSGKVSSGKGESLMPSDIHFSNEKCDDDTVASKDCLILSGLTCEWGFRGDNWSSRWKGVTAEFEKDMGENITTDWIVNTIRKSNLKLSNMSAYVEDVPCLVTVEDITILDSDWGTEVHLDKELFNTEILFE